MGVGGRRSRREIDVYTRARVRVALGRARRRRVDRAVVRRGGGRYVVMKSFMHACMHACIHLSLIVVVVRAVCCGVRVIECVLMLCACAVMQVFGVRARRGGGECWAVL